VIAGSTDNPQSLVFHRSLPLANNLHIPEEARAPEDFEAIGSIVRQKTVHPLRPYVFVTSVSPQAEYAEPLRPKIATLRYGILPMTPKPRPDDYPPSEATKRRDAALRAALSMPAIPHAESSPKAKKKVAPKRRQKSSGVPQLIKAAAT